MQNCAEISGVGSDWTVGSPDNTGAIPVYGDGADMALLDEIGGVVANHQGNRN